MMQSPGFVLTVSEAISPTDPELKQLRKNTRKLQNWESSEKEWLGEKSTPQQRSLFVLDSLYF